MKFPRHVFRKRKTVFSLEEMLQNFNTYNGVKDCYLSLYNFELINGIVSYDNTEIDKIFFDFDSEQAYEKVLKFHVYLLNHDIRHKILFSGRGFHLYVMCTGKVVNKKGSIANLQKDLAKKAGLTIGNPKEADIDEHIIGDIARIARYPYTRNLKTDLYCILLNEVMLKNGLDYIKKTALTPKRCPNFMFGSNPINLTTYDKPDMTFEIEMKNLQNTDHINEEFPMCIKQLLAKKDCVWKDRFYVIIWLRDNGFTLRETIVILKKYLTEKKFFHCIYEERQVDYLYRMNGRYCINVDELHKHVGLECKNCEIENMYKKW